jgi:hypothetical protein
MQCINCGSSRRVSKCIIYDNVTKLMILNDYVCPACFTMYGKAAREADRNRNRVNKKALKEFADLLK